MKYTELEKQAILAAEKAARNYKKCSLALKQLLNYEGSSEEEISNAIGGVFKTPPL